jgi:predicted nucleic acid-binding Zn finger protein
MTKELKSCKHLKRPIVVAEKAPRLPRVEFQPVDFKGVLLLLEQ